MSLRISSKGPIFLQQAISECTINWLQHTLLQEKKGSQEDSDPQKAVPIILGVLVVIPKISSS